jgi:hypothetical protein
VSTGSKSKYLLYAVGEVLLVMVGILLALQVDNWNQNRIEREKERKLIEILDDELSSNLEYITWIVASFRDKMESGKFLLEHFDPAPGPMPLDTLLWHLSNATSMAGFAPKIVAFNRIINNQEFDLISNDSLKLMLLEYDAQLKLAINNYSYTINWNFGDRVPLKNAIGGLSQYREVGKLYQETELSSLPESRLVQLDSRQILSDSELEAYLAHQYDRFFWTSGRLSEVCAYIRILQLMISEYYK